MLSCKFSQNLLSVLTRLITHTYTSPDNWRPRLPQECPLSEYQKWQWMQFRFEGAWKESELTTFGQWFVKSWAHDEKSTKHAMHLMERAARNTDTPACPWALSKKRTGDNFPNGPESTCLTCKKRNTCWAIKFVDLRSYCTTIAIALRLITTRLIYSLPSEQDTMKSSRLKLLAVTIARHIRFLADKISLVTTFA